MTDEMKLLCGIKIIELSKNDHFKRQIQSRVAKLVAYVWLAITPFKIAIGLKVRGVLESSHH